MLIRDLERPFLQRSRSAKDVHPLRKTAEGLGAFLDRLSEAVREDDSVDSVLQPQRRGGHLRGFKFPVQRHEGEEAAAAASPAVVYDLTEDEAEALDKLRAARDAASDATNVVVPAQDRETAQARMQALLFEVNSKRIGILSDMLSERASAFASEYGVGGPAGVGAAGSFFSLDTPDAAREAYVGIDAMIMRLLNAGRDGGAGGVLGADFPYMDHGAAISAAEQLRDFLINEGSAKAFARFREINRSNVLGLLQD